MQWKARIPKYIHHGEKRTKRCFAWLPVVVNTDDPQPVAVWLEWYIKQQEFRADAYGPEWQTIARYTEIPF